MLIAQKIANLLDGISQKPPEFRPSSQAEIQENVISDRVLGLRRRPPTKHVAKLSTDTTGFPSAFIHQVRQSVTDRYDVMVVDGDLKVYDAASGAEQTVIFPAGKAYLTSTKGFKAFTVGDKTYIVNMDTVVRRATKKAPAQAYEALVSVQEAEFGTTYSVTLNGIPGNVTTSASVSPQSQLQVSTSALASSIAAALLLDSQLSADFSITTVGSSVYIKRNDGADFTITTTDGLADKGLSVVKGSVQTFADLPSRAVNGMIVEIVGDPESILDDYWVQYSDANAPGQMGSWLECAAPGTPVALDETTMPWALERFGVIVGGVTNDAVPLLPTFTRGGVTPSTTAGFTHSTGGTSTGDVDIILTADGDEADGPITGADGSPQTVRSYYDVDTMGLDYGLDVRVSFQVDTGSGYVERAAKDYTSGVQLANESMEYTASLPTGSTVKLSIRYGGTPTSPATVNAHASGNSGGAGIYAFSARTLIASCPATAIYPAGCSVAVTLNGTTFTHTVTADETGASVATALSGIITGFTVAFVSAGSFSITQATTISWVPTSAVTKPNTVMIDSSLTMTPNEHVGRTVKNLTDGSTGTITANGVHSITVSSLAGGILDAFSPGDLCQILGSASDFVFSTTQWGERKAGDLTVCPMPSFVDAALNEVFFYQNRLGFTSGAHIVMSQSGGLTNFMRQTATQLLPDDVIDIVSAFPTVSTFENAVEWNDLLYLFSNAGHQFALEGNPVLSPQTVTLTHKSSFPMTGTVRPVTAGKYLYFGRAKSTFTQIMQYFLTLNGRADAVDLTLDVPQYITGAPVFIVNDPAIEFIAVLASGETDCLWVYSYHYEGDQTSPYAMPQKTMSSWSKWTFSGAQIVAISMLDGILSLVLLRSDGVYLETVDVGVLPVGSANYNDRQGTTPLVPYTSRWRASTLFMRDAKDTPETRGRLQLGYVTLNYHDSCDFQVVVTPLGRASYTYTFHSDTPATGDFVFPIQTRNLQAAIEVSTAAAGGFALSGLDWEGNYTTRDKRV